MSNWAVDENGWFKYQGTTYELASGSLTSCDGGLLHEVIRIVERELTKEIESQWIDAVDTLDQENKKLRDALNHQLDRHEPPREVKTDTTEAYELALGRVVAAVEGTDVKRLIQRFMGWLRFYQVRTELAEDDDRRSRYSTLVTSLGQILNSDPPNNPLDLIKAQDKKAKNPKRSSRKSS